MNFNNNSNNGSVFRNNGLNNPTSAPNLNNGGRVPDVITVFDTTWKANHSGNNTPNKKNMVNNNGKPGYQTRAEKADSMTRNIEGNAEINRGVKLGGIIDNFRK